MRHSSILSPIWLAFFGLCVCHAQSTYPGDSTANKLSPYESALKSVDSLLSETDYRKLRGMAKLWSMTCDAGTRKEIVLLLVKGLPSKKPLKLANYGDVFVPSRVPDKMPFYGHGVQVDQDIFIEGGRCAWALEDLLGIKIETISEEMPEKERQTACMDACLQIIARMRLTDLAEEKKTATRPIDVGGQAKEQDKGTRSN